MTPEERAAIDAAIHAGKVQHIPRGVSGLPKIKWCAKSNQLRYDCEAALSRMFMQKQKTLNEGRKKKKRIAALAALELWKQGMNRIEIAEATGVNVKTVSRYWSLLRKEGLME
jgi:hypothetical protein